MKSTLIAAAFATLTLAGVSMPAQAASAMVCDANYDISANQDTLIAKFASEGIVVDQVDDWGGCARITVTAADGSTGFAYFNPETMQQLAGVSL